MPSDGSPCRQPRKAYLVSRGYHHFVSSALRFADATHLLNLLPTVTNNTHETY